MIEINVLVTSAGVATAINVISALKKSKIYNCKIITTDMSEEAVGLYLSDNYYITPQANDQSFLPKIIEIIRKEKIDFIFPMHSSETLLFSKNLFIFKDLDVGITIANQSAVKKCVDKVLFEKHLSENSFISPHSYINSSDIEDYPVFIKLKVGSSSIGAYKISDLNELEFYLKNNENNYIIQEFISWQEVTIDCFVSKLGFLIACVPRFRLKVKDGKSVVAKTFFSEEVLSQVRKLLGSLEYRGACNIQMFYKNDEVKIIEINPRLAAGGLPLAVAAGVNIPELMIKDYYEQLENKLIDYNSNLKMYRYLTEVFI
ncbi:MAG: hypothetical protein COB02_03730 [Candidatus Cloacimonadota bacterium]|nr:MAG: hypothetical protein COB02_03730 [Candidatus Cloacimonadota bacterium]